MTEAYLRSHEYRCQNELQQLNLSRDYPKWQPIQVQCKQIRRRRPLIRFRDISLISVVVVAVVVVVTAIAVAVIVFGAAAVAVFAVVIAVVAVVDVVVIAVAAIVAAGARSIETLLK